MDEEDKGFLVENDENLKKEGSEYKFTIQNDGLENSFELKSSVGYIGFDSEM